MPIRNYSSAREAALARNNIPESVYDNLVSTINEHLRCCIAICGCAKEILNLDKLHMYDLYTPLVKDVKLEVSYGAQELLLAGLARW